MEPDPDDRTAAPDDGPAPHFARFVDMHREAPRQRDVARQREPQTVEGTVADPALAYEPESRIERLGGTQPRGFPRAGAPLSGAICVKRVILPDDPIGDLAPGGHRFVKPARFIRANSPAVLPDAFEHPGGRPSAAMADAVARV